MTRRTERTTPSVTVIERVADREGTDPVRLDPPLHDVVDPDALDAFCADSDTTGCVTFSYCGYTVTVGIDGTVDLEERASAGRTDPCPAASAD